MDTTTVTTAESLGCVVCTAYFIRRGRVVAMWAAIYADRRGVSPRLLLRSFLASVHARHLAGGSLSTRVSTPPLTTGTNTRIKVHRCCSGCGTDLGDARPDELEAAVAGRDLPDTSLECGCFVPASA